MSDHGLEFTDELTVGLVDHMGTELSIVNAARVSFNEASQEMTDRDRGLLRFLLRNRHASPFEHVTATFLVECPLFVRSEWHRHRTQSFNEWSGRYSEYIPRFYVPNPDRPLIQQGKAGDYHFVVGSNEQYETVDESYHYACGVCWVEYTHMLDKGIAKEVARNVLPVTTYTKFYATANLRNWINFLSLRAEEHALYEIRQLAGQVETILHRYYPETLNAWDEYGRGPV